MEYIVCDGIDKCLKYQNLNYYHLCLEAQKSKDIKNYGICTKCHLQPINENKFCEIVIMKLSINMAKFLCVIVANGIKKNVCIVLGSHNHVNCVINSGYKSSYCD